MPPTSVVAIASSPNDLPVIAVPTPGRLARRTGRLPSRRCLAGPCDHARGRRLQMITPRIEVLAVDLDGTALGSSGVLSSTMCDALDAAAAHGLRVWFVSARPVWSIRSLTSSVCKPDLAIGAAGAVVIDRCDRLMLRRPLSAAAVQHSLDTTQRHHGAALVYRGEQVSTTGAHPRLDVEVRVTARHPPEPEDGSPADKILVFTTEGSALEQALDASGDHQLARSSSILLEVTARGVDKGSALAAAAATEGVGQHAMAAVGDSANDLPMLRWVGLPIAVANAVPSVLDVAAVHVPSNDEDGVAVWIDSWMSGRSVE